MRFFEKQNLKIFGLLSLEISMFYDISSLEKSRLLEKYFLNLVLKSKKKLNSFLKCNEGKLCRNSQSKINM